MPLRRGCWPAAHLPTRPTPSSTCTAPSCGKWTPPRCCRQPWMATSGERVQGSSSRQQAQQSCSTVAGRGGVCAAEGGQQTAASTCYLRCCRGMPSALHGPLHARALLLPHHECHSYPVRTRCAPLPTQAGCTCRACWTATPTCTSCTWMAGRRWRRCRPLASASRGRHMRTGRRARTCCW